MPWRATCGSWALSLTCGLSANRLFHLIFLKLFCLDENMWKFTTTISLLYLAGCVSVKQLYQSQHSQFPSGHPEPQIYQSKSFINEWTEMKVIPPGRRVRKIPTWWTIRQLFSLKACSRCLNCHISSLQTSLSQNPLSVPKPFESKGPVSVTQTTKTQPASFVTLRRSQQQERGRGTKEKEALCDLHVWNPSSGEWEWNYRKSLRANNCFSVSWHQKAAGA